MAFQRSYQSVSFLHGMMNNPDRKKDCRRVMLLFNKEKEILLQLTFEEEYLKNLQKDIARDLLEIYETKPSTTYNQNKIQKFNNVINPPPKAVSGWEKFKKWLGNPGSRTMTFNLHGWFTSVRLFLLRANRIAIFSGFQSTAPIFSFYLSCIRIGGLSYFLNLAIDFGTIFYETFCRERSAHEKTLPLLKCIWERFRAVMLEEDDKGSKRMYRMINDAAWVSINAVGIFFSGGSFILVNAIINVAGFGFDVLNEFVLGVVDYYKISRLEAKLDANIRDHRNEYRNMNNTVLSEAEKDQLRNEAHILKIIREKVKEKKLTWLNGRLRVVICLSMVVVGMVFCFFPPAVIPGAAIIGAVMAFVFGSLTTGLGPRLFKLVEDTPGLVVSLFTPSAPSSEALEPQPNNDNDLNPPPTNPSVVVTSPESTVSMSENTASIGKKLSDSNNKGGEEKPKKEKADKSEKRGIKRLPVTPITEPVKSITRALSDSCLTAANFDRPRRYSLGIYKGQENHGLIVEPVLRTLSIK